MSTAIQKAVEACGSQSELARRIGKKQGHVWYWLHSGRAAPDVCQAIERATDGVVTAAELRPDVFGPPSPDDAAA